MNYTFSNASNSYFMGNDVLVAREDDDRTVKINGKERYCAINVKDHSGSWVHDLPEDVREQAADLNKANASRATEWEGQEWTDVLYQHACEQWWEEANDLAIEAGFEGVYSAGRSGGWCCIDGTNTDYHPDWIMYPEQQGEDREDALAFQQRFLQLAFDLQDLIDHYREWWADMIEQEHAELEREREECIVLGND